jgi:3-hydroxyisobutyrate dehydrogenase-like beta-hydroxyacid dehydrogenase
VKDLGLIHDEAKRAGSALFLGALAEQRLIEAAGRGWGDNDMAAVVKLWEEPACLTVDHPRK